MNYKYKEQVRKSSNKSDNYLHYELVMI